MDSLLPPIPAKRYFTIGEVGELCGVKPHVLRYWEQEFTQLRPVKRRGNRRYYQRHEVMMIRRIRGLLYDQGFTISGARNKLLELTQSERQLMRSSDYIEDDPSDPMIEQDDLTTESPTIASSPTGTLPSGSALFASTAQDMPLLEELLHIRWLLSV
jgi:DNA-binding transcriptional MerR regulator